MRDYSISDIRKTNSAYEDMILHESFLSPYDLKYDTSIPYTGGLRSKYTKKGIGEAKEYLSSLDSDRSVRVFLSMNIHEIRRMFAIQYGLEFVAQGSSRLVFKASDNSVLKIATNLAGLVQNKAEAHDLNVKNGYGCFPYIFWKSRNNNLAIEVESLGELGNEMDFYYITGVDFDDFVEFLAYEQMVSSTGKNRTLNIPKKYAEPIKGEWEYQKRTYDEISKELNEGNTVPKKILKNFAHYCRTHRSSREYVIRDLTVIENWGKTTRNGVEVCIPSDLGGTSHVLSNYYDEQGHPIEMKR